MASLWRGWNGFAVRTAFFGPWLAFRFRWRNLGVLVERLLCTTLNDLRRYRTAKDTSLPLELRQAMIVDSVINQKFLVKLVEARRFKSPLSLRNGIWSARKSAADGNGRQRVFPTPGTRHETSEMSVLTIEKTDRIV